MWWVHGVWGVFLLVTLAAQPAAISVTTTPNIGNNGYLSSTEQKTPEDGEAMFLGLGVSGAQDFMMFGQWGALLESNGLLASLKPGSFQPTDRLSLSDRRPWLVATSNGGDERRDNSVGKKGKDGEEEKTEELVGSPSSFLEKLKLVAFILRAIAWPLVVGLLIAYIAKSRNAPKRIAQILKPFRSFKWRGVEIVLSEEGAKELAQSTEEAFSEYRKQAKREYDRLSGVYSIKERIDSVVQSEVREILGGVDNIQDLRCTIHVPDILFTETLYQLIDYYPKGGGRGRTKSARFGIIGKAWRLGRAQNAGDVPTDDDLLILEWGMTKEEALAAGQGRQSFTSIVLKGESGIPVGIFYMDSTSTDAFGASDKDKARLNEAVISGCQRTELTKSLERLNEELRSRAPLIHIHD